MLLELSEFVQRALVPQGTSLVKFDDRRVISVQRYLVFYMVRELEKSGVAIDRREKVAGPFPASTLAVLS